MEWHYKGDYFITVSPSDILVINFIDIHCQNMISSLSVKFLDLFFPGIRESRAILIHRLSKKLTYNPVKKLHGLPVSSVFHPSRRILFIATKKNVRVYDLSLEKPKYIKKLEPSVREISSVAVHPGG